MRNTSRKPITELRSVTCHIGSHSVTCHQTQVNLTPASQAGRYSIYLSRRNRGLSWSVNMYTDTGECRIPCINGGTCTSLNVCACPDGYRGVFCQKRESTFQTITVLFHRTICSVLTIAIKVWFVHPSIRPHYASYTSLCLSDSSFQALALPWK